MRWVRVGALTLTIWLQLVFLVILLLPIPPLPPRPVVTEDLELLLEDLLVQEEHLVIPRVDLGSGPRSIQTAPLRQPARNAARAALPRVELAAPTSVLQPRTQTAPLAQPQLAAVPPAPPQAQPAVPAPAAASPAPAQPAPATAPPAPRAVPVRVVQVDPTPRREWGQEVPVVSPPPTRLPPLQQPATAPVTAVMTPDRVAPAARHTPAPTRSSAPELPRPEPALHIPMPALSRSEARPVSRVAPTAPTMEVPTLPQVQLAPGTTAVEVAPRPLTLAATEAVVMETLPPPALEPALVVPAAPPLRERAPLQRVEPTAPSMQSSIALPDPTLAPVNQQLLSSERVAQPVPAAPTVPIQPMQLSMPAPEPVQAAPDPASLRAVQPRSSDPRQLAQAAQGPAPVAMRELASGSPQLEYVAPEGVDADADSATQAPAAALAAAAGGERSAVRSEFDGPSASAPARSAADLLAGVSGVARDQLQAGASAPQGHRDSFLDRRYDPFHDELPDRLKLIQSSDPGAVRQVLQFLARSLAGGGVSLRGRRLEAGAEALNRRMLTEQDLERSLGMLLEHWRDLYDGDTRLACEQTQADMPEQVRQLLCGAP